MLYASFVPGVSFGGQGGIGANACTVTQRVVAIDTTSREVVAANARVAWASIQQPFTATNTVSLGFDTAAVATSSFRLGTSTGSNAPDVFVYGLNTDMPFVGAVNARASAASTTVSVTVCSY